MQFPPQREARPDHSSDSRSEFFFLKITPAHRSPASIPPPKTLCLRSPDGQLLGITTYRAFRDRFVISRFACRQYRVELGLKLIKGLQVEAGRSRIESIWLEALSQDAMDSLYERCGFQKKAFYQEDPEAPSSSEKGLWILPLPAPRLLDQRKTIHHSALSEMSHNVSWREKRILGGNLPVARNAQIDRTPPLDAKMSGSELATG